ncbi:MAG: ABC transporter substrate-binding protein [Acaryochloridaceae cyanobacterium RU_4_10]|nr:ABC transporter substrate-binding protein [Acaryochloridaceae cyanobacterium RU_4_10]
MFQSSKYKEAIDCFKEAIEADPTDPIAQIFLNNARAYLRGCDCLLDRPLKVVVVVSYSQNVFHIDATQNVLKGVADAQDKFYEGNRKSGRLLEIIVADDRNQPEVSKKLAEIFSNDETILGIIGHHSSEGTQAALSIYEQKQLALISPSSTSSRLISRIFFRTVGSTEVVANVYARFITESLKLNEIVIVYHEKNEYSQTLKDDFETAFHLRGGKIIHSISHINDLYLDSNGLIEEIRRRTKSKAVLVMSSIETNSVALALARANSKLNPQRLQLLFSTSLPEMPTVEIGKEAVEEVVFISPCLTENSDYTEQARQRWKQQKLNWRVVTSHDATQALIEAIRFSKQPTRRKVLTHLEELAQTSRFGLNWSALDCHSSPQRGYCIVQICNHRFEEIPIPDG